MTGIYIVPGRILTRVWDRKIVSFKLGWVLIAESLFCLILSIGEFALVAFSISIVIFCQKGQKLAKSVLACYIHILWSKISILQCCNLKKSI